MKQIFKISGFLLVVVCMLVSSRSMGQAKVEISPYAGYMFGGSLNFYEGKLKAENGLNYGVAMDVKLANDTQIELMWTQMGTTAYFDPYYSYEYLATDSFDMNIGYIQIGGVREMEMGKVNPFGVFTLGTTYFIPKDVTFEGDNFTTDIGSVWKFSMTMGAGVKIWLSDVVGIRLQGNLMLPMFWGGSTYGYAGYSMGGGTSMVQGNFTGGLIFALGD